MRFVVKRKGENRYLKGQGLTSFGVDYLDWTSDINEAMIFTATLDAKSNTAKIEPSFPFYLRYTDSEDLTLRPITTWEIYSHES